jgi:hypothetical protein
MYEGGDRMVVEKGDRPVVDLKGSIVRSLNYLFKQVYL